MFCVSENWDSGPIIHSVDQNLISTVVNNLIKHVLLSCNGKIVKDPDAYGQNACGNL